VRNQAGEFEVRPIRIGVADFQFAEVMDGLQSGDVVSLVRPEKSVGDLHTALSKLAANQAVVNTNTLTSATNRTAPAAN
jgi:hypothetical protein